MDSKVAVTEDFLKFIVESFACLIGDCATLADWSQRVKDQGHDLTRYGQKGGDFRSRRLSEICVDFFHL